MLKDIVCWLVQYVPEWFVRRWPLRKWFCVRADRDAVLAELELETDYIVDARTGLMSKGSARIQ